MKRHKKGSKQSKLEKIFEFVGKYFYQVTVKDIAQLCKITVGAASDYLKISACQFQFETIEIDRSRAGKVYAIKHYKKAQMSIFDLMEVV